MACNNFQSKHVPSIIIMKAHTKHFQSWHWDQSVWKYPSITVWKTLQQNFLFPKGTFSCIPTESPRKLLFSILQSLILWLKSAFRPARHKTTRKCTHTPQRVMRLIFCSDYPKKQINACSSHPCLLYLYRKRAVVCTMGYLMSHQYRYLITPINNNAKYFVVPFAETCRLTIQ